MLCAFFVDRVIHPYPLASVVYKPALRRYERCRDTDDCGRSRAAIRSQTQSSCPPSRSAIILSLVSSPNALNIWAVVFIINEYIRISEYINSKYILSEKNEKSWEIYWGGSGLEQGKDSWNASKTSKEAIFCNLSGCSFKYFKTILVSCLPLIPGGMQIVRLESLAIISYIS